MAEAIKYTTYNVPGWVRSMSHKIIYIPLYLPNYKIDMYYFTLTLNFISLVPNVLWPTTLSYSLARKLLFCFKPAAFQLIPLIYRRGNVVYYHWMYIILSFIVLSLEIPVVYTYKTFLIDSITINYLILRWQFCWEFQLPKECNYL